MSLLLAPSVSSGLEAASSLSPVDIRTQAEEAVAMLVPSRSGSGSGSGSSPEKASSTEAGSGTAKACAAAIATVLVEASKLHATWEDVAGVLGDAGVSEECLAELKPVFGDAQSAIRMTAGDHLTEGVATLRDVDVSLKYTVRTDDQEKVNTPQYVVSVTYGVGTCSGMDSYLNLFPSMSDGPVLVSSSE